MTGLEVRLTDTFPDEIEAWQSCTAFHSRGWNAVAAQCFNAQTVHLIVGAGNQTVAYLPVVAGRFARKSKAGPIQSSHAPQLIFADGTHDLHEELARLVAARVPDARILGTSETSSTSAFTLNLSGTFADYWRERVSAKAKYDVRKSEREELVTRLECESGLVAFYPLYLRRMRELGSPAIGQRVFRAMSAQLGDAMRFAVTTLDGNVVAASVVLLHRGRWMAHPWSVSHSDFRRLSVNYGHYRDLIRFGFEHGYETFSLGTSLANSPWCRIKQRFGAQAAPVIRLDGKPFIHASQRIPVRIAGSVIKRLPRRVFETASPWIAALGSRLLG